MINMRALKIEAIDNKNNLIFKIIAHRIDATQTMTVINTTTTGKNADNIRIVSEIDHWNIIEGMVTIYYKSGSIMEISRINI